MAGYRFFGLGRANANTNLSLAGRVKQRPPGITLALGLVLLVGSGLLVAWMTLRPANSNGLSEAFLTDVSPSLITGALASMRPGATTADETAPRTGLAYQPQNATVLANSALLLGQHEVRLAGIYHLIQQSQLRQALREAEALVKDHPNFQLAQLVLGDLLNLQTRPVTVLGGVADTQALAAARQLQELREQSRRRLAALTERPPEGTVPSQFLALSSRSRHAIAIDASRSRLYLFENTATPSSDTQGRLPAARMKLVADFYISVGTAGVDKRSEGDLRTPLGVYYITSKLDPDKLPDLYGTGALPINYPNGLDMLRGNTGSGIWLHGSPSEQFARAPLASEGCVVLSNPDFDALLARVSIRTTPVVIATELQWVHPEALQTEREAFETTLASWRDLKSAGDLTQLQQHYSPRFNRRGQKLDAWWPRVQDEVKNQDGRRLHIKDLSVLRWRDQDDTLVVTFGEVAEGARRGVTKRQYWVRENNQWKIFSEGSV